MIVIDTDLDTCIQSLRADGRTAEEIIGDLLLAGHELETIYAAMLAADTNRQPAEPALSTAEQQRYAAQMRVLAALQRPDLDAAFIGPEHGRAAQLALKQAIVLIADCGELGERLLYALAKLGIGRLYTVATTLPVSATTVAQRTAAIQALNPFVTYLDLDDSEQIPAELREQQPNLLIYCPDRFDLQVAGQINQACIEQQTALLTYRRRRFGGEIGPLLIPGETACYECLTRRRLAVASDHERLLAGQTGAPGLPGIDLGFDWLVFEVVKFLTGIAEPISRGRLLRFDALSGTSEVHTVLRLPRCPACGIHQARPLRKLWEE
jgi:bacteriocin biosynthesis cyclodehydratase domain-containing protein